MRTLRQVESRLRTGLLGALGALVLAVATARTVQGADPRERGEVERTERRERVEVRVVEVAGGRAYLTPGAERGVQVGDRVQVGGASYVVVAENQEHSVVELTTRALERGQRGFVMVARRKKSTFAERPAPRPLTDFVGQWLAPPLPAEAQTPRFVPLGVMSDARRNRAAFTLDYQRIEPLSGPAVAIGRTRLRALLHAELETVPLSLDADGFAEFWHADDLALRPQNASRPFLTVRQLELGYRGEGLQAAAGRLRHASRSLGVLDGARVSAPLVAGFGIGAFGGTLPNPLDGGVETDAARFGAHLTWQDEDAPARPRANLELYGSRFAGSMDERRLSASIESYPEFGRLAAQAEASLFDRDNPWGAAPSELTAAGADATVRLGSLRLGAALDLRAPERSRWLAAFLPPGYFCRAEPLAGVQANEPCVGGDRRFAALLNGGWDSPLWTLDVGATYATTRRAAPEQATAFFNVRRRDLLGALRVEAGASASRGSIIESAALDLGAGAALGEAADLGIYYRPSLTRYRAELDPFLEHGAGGRFWWAPSPAFDLNGSLEVVSGRDVDVLLLQVGAAFRPRF